ncbi:unnamed protein product [Candidula unifasciata]|uniref:Uncharacterized protein n=1 Tax=Candidula unifasciata TaxID=100452 RepID=A0A8S3Z762_9EUPU|nr:unnamed protein product [Candidula unifasciata]
MKVLLMAICVCVALAQRAEDPLCVQKGCPRNKTCRVVKDCATPRACSLKALCLTNPPQFSHTGVCQVGQPILEKEGRSWADSKCGPTFPCPDTTYCNTELQDTYSTCCRSDPDNPVKNGTCPASTRNDTFYCVDTCNNDGDCRGDDKCCQDGCARSCRTPLNNVCQTKTCPENSYCLTPEMNPCTSATVCYKVGDCVPCGPVCYIQCPNGFVKDPKGCPTCVCKSTRKY